MARFWLFPSGKTTNNVEVHAVGLVLILSVTQVKTHFIRARLIRTVAHLTHFQKIRLFLFIFWETLFDFCRPVGFATLDIEYDTYFVSITREKRAMTVSWISLVIIDHPDRKFQQDLADISKTLSGLIGEKLWLWERIFGFYIRTKRHFDICGNRFSQIRWKWV